MDWATIPIPRNYSDLYRFYGNPADKNFERDYIVVNPHQLADGSTIRVHSHIAIVPKLHNVWAVCRDSIKTYDGCYVYRNVRGSQTHLSIHSWGLAIDLNADRFPLGSTDRQTFELTAQFKKLGFFYGGDFHHRQDPMHWQFAGDF